jgi:hypothetical protein
MLKLAFACAALLVASNSFAQTIYEPLQYQFGRENKYFYGGTDPRVHDLANRLCSPGRTYARVQGYRWVTKTRVVEREQPRIYSDLFPRENAWFYDYSADDAVNDLRAQQPRYYRKGDLTIDAKTLDDGTLVVPAIPRPVERPRVITNPARPGEIIIKPSAQPSKQPMIFRFPKELLQKRLDATGNASGSRA